MYQKIKLYFVFILLLGCSAETETFEIEGLNFYPTDVGHFISYDVTETTYALRTAPQITDYQVKERVVGVFKEAENGNPTIYKINRYQRKDASENWNLDEVWTFRKDNQRIIKTESGTPFVILTFPLRDGEIWNGNGFNNLGRQNYQMTDLQGVYASEIDNFVFENTLTVREAQDSSAVEKNCSRAVYSENVGLVYRVSEQYFYCQTNDCFGAEIIDSGQKIEQKITDFGVE